nr:MAG: hypothetical protein BECKMB1821I_GA0114274_1001103 [Candidatus Kentron sp. MB]
MARNSGGASNDTPFSNVNASCYRYTARDSGMGSDIYIMPNLNLVIYFYTILKDGILQRASIYCGIGSDFHVVTNPHRTELWYSNPCTIVVGNTKTIATDDNSGMDKHSFPDDNILAERYVSYQARMIAHDSLFTHNTTGSDIHLRAD